MSQDKQYSAKEVAVGLFKEGSAQLQTGMLLSKVDTGKKKSMCIMLFLMSV